jgi:hypothetical protein
MLVAAAIQIVTRIPKAGSKKNPAMIVPTIAPSKFNP